jgi:2-dehydro-3-deoxygalactonokinase
MSFSDTFLAVDWGTTNRRVYRIEDGQVVATERDDKGVTAVADFPGEVARIRERFGDLPLLMAGMVGSNIGWRLAPYVAAPAGIAEIAASLLWIDPRTAIVPGISVSTPPDVMRGEEVQLLGAVAGTVVPLDALVVQPGTHSKWIEISDGRIAGFTTVMTGELFGLLRNHGVLAAQLGSDVSLGDAFLEGVAEGAKRDLCASLFGIRAAKLLGVRDDADAASFASGLLIGAEIAARFADKPHQVIYLLADPILGALYASAIAAQGREARIVDSQAVFVAGILAIGSQT